MILVISSKKVYVAQRLLQEARIRNYELRIMDIQDLVACNFKVDVKKFSAIYIRDPYLQGSPKYLPEVVKSAKKFKAAGKKVVDLAIASGQIGKGKWSDYRALKKAGLPIPKTEQLTINNLQLTYPLILKWIYGFKARNVFLVKSENELGKILPIRPKKEWLAQEFIKAEYEYKIITVGYKALPVILKFKINENGFRTDFNKAEVIYQGVQPGIFEGSQKYPGSRNKLESGSRLSDALGRDGAKKLMTLAEKASRVLKRELSKVDILEAGGKFYILEVNRFPGLDSFEKLTGCDVVGKFLEYLSR
jgi:glutathione synthase/RimK-type ligase-like ATP-grasp enzyme